MLHFLPSWRLVASTCLAALLAACGGGSGDTTPRTAITSVKVFGDSLADSGTFRLPDANNTKIRFTVQGADTQIYPERIAAAYGLGLCPFYLFTSTTFTANNLETGCSNFAIGGGRINSIDPTIPNVSPQLVGVQLATAATLAGAGGYTAGDLLVIDGGGNDAADLIGAFLTLQQNPASTTYTTLAASLLGAQVGTILGAAPDAATGLAQVGGAYMQALATTFHGQIKAQALDKGAQHVVLINMPDVTNTPRFKAVLAQVAAGSSQAAADQAKALFTQWISAFNATLAGLVAGDGRVVLVDLFTAFNDEVAHPAQFGLDNVTDPLCALSAGLPEFAACTADALSAAPPTGGTADWWKRHLFSDGFHPSPYGHQLFYQRVSLDLARAGLL
jgi:phospholipase/lecithinase/hemolysin